MMDRSNAIRRLVLYVAVVALVAGTIGYVQFRKNSGTEYVPVAQVDNDGERTLHNEDVVVKALEAHHIPIAGGPGSSAAPILVPKSRRNEAIEVLKGLPGPILSKIEFVSEEITGGRFIMRYVETP